MKLTDEQIAKIIDALTQHRFDVFAEMYAPEITREEWPIVVFEDHPEGFYVGVGILEDVLKEIEL